MPIRAIETTRGTVRITIVDDLTLADLEHISKALQQTPRGEEVEVDLRAARDCTPTALDALTHLLSSIRVRWNLVGVSSSNQRVLEYLGTAARPQPPGAAEPE